MANYVPNYDNELVKRYKRAGLVCVGRTNTPEFGLSVTTESSLLGPARNPWDTDRSTGGASGGAAAAVAARMVPIAHGSDGGGSIRIPSSSCGVFGMKPSRGRMPTGPELGEVWEGLATNHALSISVRDNAALLDATSAPGVGAPYGIPAPVRPFVKEVGASPGKLKEEFIERQSDHSPFTWLHNVTGLPAMSVPLFWNTQGLPIGVRFTSRYADEAILYRLAGQLEAARPWKAKIPPI
ncbi:MAG: amidase [Desulfobacterales bacterium]|nr:amidase [Desulfobacterales bacterium]